jgi:hypothetical protein
MCLTKYIILFTVLILTTFLISPSKAETCTTNDLGDRTCTTTTAGTTTGNVLNNSTFGTSGYSTQDWTISGDVGQGHSTTSGTTYTGQNTSGGNLAFEGDPKGSIYQDVDLVGDGHLTKSQINEGFTSTMSADIWFWNNTENTTTLKQTITTGDGTVTTQIRNINDHDPNRANNGGQWNNYTDSYTHNTNTQTDFTIRAEVSNDTAGTSYDGTHRGPDVDNIQLSITTAGVQSSTFTPCEELGTCTSAGEAVNDAVNLTTDDGVDLFTDLDTKVEDAFKEVEKMEDVKVEEIKFETVLVEDDLGKIEEVEFKEFVEMQFTSFIEENNLVEEFKTELKVEGISEEEFFDELGDTMMKEIETEMMAELDMKEPEMLEEPKVEEIKEEELSEPELKEEIKEEEIKQEEVKEESINEESNKEESNESTEPDTNTNEEIKEESNETTEKPEDSESVSNESEVAEDKETEGTKEEETDGENVEDEAVESDEAETGEIKVSSINEKVQRVLNKVLSKLKRVDQKLQAIQMVTSQGITAGEADLSGYINKRIYTKQVALNGVPNPDFFQNLNILEQQQIYKDANLAAYVSNDPIAVKQKLLQEINVDKQRLLLELKALKNEG